MKFILGVVVVSLLEIHLFAENAHQPPLTVTLSVFDAAGRFRHLTFGVHPDATYEFENAFNEMLMPPIPPAPVFDIRFADVNNLQRLAGTGSETDIRTFVSSEQVDTFIVRIQVAQGALPLRLVWTGEGRANCDSLKVEYIENSIMKTTDAATVGSFEVWDESTSLLKIYLFGPRWKK